MEKLYQGKIKLSLMEKLTGLKKIKTAVFISGTGSNLKNIIKFSKIKKSPISIDLIISNTNKAEGLIYADQFNIKKKIFNFKDNTKTEKKILTLLKKDSLVVLVSSISGSRGSYDPIYSASKAALHGFTKSMSQWLTPKTKIICLCPGPVKETRNFKRFSKKRQDFHIKKNPLKKLINSKEFARILLDVTKPHWKFANGSIIEINGGVY